MRQRPARFIANRAFLSENHRSHSTVHDRPGRDLNELLGKGEAGNTNNVAGQLREIGTVNALSDFRCRAECCVDVQHVERLFNKIIEGRAKLLQYGTCVLISLENLSFHGLERNRLSNGIDFGRCDQTPLTIVAELTGNIDRILDLDLDRLCVAKCLFLGNAVVWRFSAWCVCFVRHRWLIEKYLELETERV